MSYDRIQNKTAFNPYYSSLNKRNEGVVSNNSNNNEGLFEYQSRDKASVKNNYDYAGMLDGNNFNTPQTNSNNINMGNETNNNFFATNNAVNSNNSADTTNNIINSNNTSNVVNNNVSDSNNVNNYNTVNNTNVFNLVMPQQQMVQPQHAFIPPPKRQELPLSTRKTDVENYDFKFSNDNFNATIKYRKTTVTTTNSGGHSGGPLSIDQLPYTPPLPVDPSAPYTPKDAPVAADSNLFSNRDGSFNALGKTLDNVLGKNNSLGIYDRMAFNEFADFNGDNKVDEYEKAMATYRLTNNINSNQWKTLLLSMYKGVRTSFGLEPLPDYIKP
ncbi:MAG: hypothetical protein WCK67_07265 [bacterium]